MAGLVEDILYLCGREGKGGQGEGRERGREEREGERRGGGGGRGREGGRAVLNFNFGRERVRQTRLSHFKLVK